MGERDVEERPEHTPTEPMSAPFERRDREPVLPPSLEDFELLRRVDEEEKLDDSQRATIVPLPRNPYNE
jgi:hypothetical protein